MYSESDHQQGNLGETIESFRELQNYTGSISEFWPAYLKAMTDIVDARFGVLALRRAAEEEEWKRMAAYPQNATGNRDVQVFNQNLEEIVEGCTLKGFLKKDGKTLAQAMPNYVILAVQLGLDKTEDVCVAAFLLTGVSQASAAQLMTRLRLMANLPIAFQQGREAQQALSDIQNYASVLDLTTMLNAEKRYLASGMTFCNELAARFGCDRVCLGWLEDKYIKLKVASHIEKFQKKMDAVKKLEVAMEEALDQNEEIIWPPPEGVTTVTRDHEAFARDQGVDYMCSIPMRLDDDSVAVLTCERNNEPFSLRDVDHLRLFCDQGVRRLDDLKRLDRWFGARWFYRTKECLGKLVGVEHTWAKIGGIVGAALLMFVCFGSLPYRVEAPFAVHSEDLAYVPAPFQGFIGQVDADIGDEVQANQLLLTLDTEELLLEEAAARAELNRSTRQAEMARADGKLADMRIALAQVEQARIRSELIAHRLAQSEIKAPFDGVIVEGDLKERVGSPVEQGEVLFKVARLENLYLELDVDEKDIHEVSGTMTGEIAFASQPKLKYPMSTVRIEPVAQTKEEGNVFICRGNFGGEVQSWWRPGMSGIAKLDVGKRNVLWIISHETIDFLRMFFWW